VNNSGTLKLDDKQSGYEDYLSCLFKSLWKVVQRIFTAQIAEIGEIQLLVALTNHSRNECVTSHIPRALCTSTKLGASKSLLQGNLCCLDPRLGC
jgi:hypothetical protein